MATGCIIYISDEHLSDSSDDGESSTSQYHPPFYRSSDSSDNDLQENMIYFLGFEISGNLVRVLYAEQSRALLHFNGNTVHYRYRTFNPDSKSWESRVSHSMMDTPLQRTHCLTSVLFCEMKRIAFGRNLRNDSHLSFETSSIFIHGDYADTISFDVNTSFYDQQNETIYIAQLSNGNVILRYYHGHNKMQAQWKKLGVLMGNLSDVQMVGMVNEQYLCFFAAIQKDRTPAKAMGFAIHILSGEWVSYSFTMLNVAPGIGLVFVMPSMENNICSAVTGYCRTNFHKSITSDIVRIIHRYYVGKKELHMITRKFTHHHCCYSDFSQLVGNLFEKGRTSAGSGKSNRIHHDLIRFTYLRYVNCTLR